MGKIYRYEQKIGGHECTYDFFMAPTAAMNYFQRASQEQSDAVGLGAEQLMAKDVAWFLVKYEIRFITYPEYEQTVIVETEPVSFVKFAAHRRFALLDTNEKPLITADTEWMLQNTKKNRVERLSNFKGLEAYGKTLSEKTFSLKNFAKIAAYESEQQFEVGFFDIDFNRHAGHVNYLRWAIEALPIDDLGEMELAGAKIIYKHQGFFGDKITAKVLQILNNIYRVDIVNGEEILLCQLELELRQRKTHAESNTIKAMQ